MGCNLLINGVYWGYYQLTNHLLTSDGTSKYWKSHQHFPSNIDHTSKKLTWGPTWFSEDKTRNDPVLSARFAQIREAYDILGDEGQRAIYDSAGLQPLEFYALFFGGEAGGKSRGSEKSWICISWIVYHDCCEGGKFSRSMISFEGFKTANWKWWFDGFLFDEIPEQMRNEQFGQL